MIAFVFCDIVVRDAYTRLGCYPTGGEQQGVAVRVHTVHVTPTPDRFSHDLVLACRSYHSTTRMPEFYFIYLSTYRGSSCKAGTEGPEAAEGPRREESRPLTSTRVMVDYQKRRC
eukprot:1190292-Prorocentrum_minimum.AAC.3